jgi:hypothetical protein
MLARRCETIFGWPLHLTTSPNKRTLYNFPVQGGGAEMLRLAAWRLCEAGFVPNMLVHDGILFELENQEQVAQAVDILRSAGRPCAGLPSPNLANCPHECCRIAGLCCECPAGRPEPDLPMSLRHPVEKPCVSGRDAPDLSGKRLELLKDMVPTCAIVAVIWNPTNSAVRELRRAR